MGAQNWIQIILIVLFIGGPVIGAIFRKLQEKREEQKRRHAVEEARREALRTGNIPEQSRVVPETLAATTPQGTQPSPAGPAESSESAARQARLQELKQRQLERLRAAAAARAGGAPSPTQAPGVAQAPTPAGPSTPSAPQSPGRAAMGGPLRERLERAAAEARRQQQQQQRPQQPPRREPQRIVRPPFTPAPRPKLSPSDREPATLGNLERVAATRRSQAVDPGRAKSTGDIAIFGSGKMTHEDWRRAIIMQEILSKPVSMREDGEGVI